MLSAPALADQFSRRRKRSRTGLLLFAWGAMCGSGWTGGVPGTWAWLARHRHGTGGPDPRRRGAVPGSLKHRAGACSSPGSALVDSTRRKALLESNLPVAALRLIIRAVVPESKGPVPRKNSIGTERHLAIALLATLAFSGIIGADQGLDSRHQPSCRRSRHLRSSSTSQTPPRQTARRTSTRFAAPSFGGAHRLPRCAGSPRSPGVPLFYSSLLSQDVKGFSAFGPPPHRWRQP